MRGGIAFGVVFRRTDAAETAIETSAPCINRSFSTSSPLRESSLGETASFSAAARVLLTHLRQVDAMDERPMVIGHVFSTIQKCEMAQ
jgi:hypothetical protein